MGYTQYKLKKCGCCKNIIRGNYLYTKVGYADQVCKNCFIDQQCEVEMERPIKISIVKEKGADYFRLQYTCGNVTVRTPGFTDKKELSKIIANDECFKLRL